METRMSKGKRYSEDQIIKVLQEIDAGASIASVARAHGITDQTIYRWRERYGGMTKSELVEMRALQVENRRLRAIVASQALDIEAYKELQKGKRQAPLHGDARWRFSWSGAIQGLDLAVCRISRARLAVPKLRIAIPSFGARCLICRKPIPGMASGVFTPCFPV